LKAKLQFAFKGETLVKFNVLLTVAIAGATPTKAAESRSRSLRLLHFTHNQFLSREATLRNLHDYICQRHRLRLLLVLGHLRALELQSNSPFKLIKIKCQLMTIIEMQIVPSKKTII